MPKNSKPLNTDELLIELEIARVNQQNATSDRLKNTFIAYENWIGLKLGKKSTRVVDDLTKEILELGPYLMSVALKITNDVDKAKDVVQEGMLKAIRYRNTYNPEKATIGTWASVIMKRLYFDMNKKRKISTISINDTYGLSSEPDNNFDMTVDNDLDKMYAAIDLLKPLPKQVVELRLKKVSFRDISTQLGISEGKAKIIMHRTKAKLKELMTNT